MDKFKIKRYFRLFFSIITCISILSGCTNSVNKSASSLSEDKVIKVVKDTNKSKESNLNDNIIVLSSDSSNCGDYNVSIIGASLFQ